jgi:hypothetical protein
MTYGLKNRGRQSGWPIVEGEEADHGAPLPLDGARERKQC